MGDFESKYFIFGIWGKIHNVERVHPTKTALDAKFQMPITTQILLCRQTNCYYFVKNSYYFPNLITDFSFIQEFIIFLTVKGCASDGVRRRRQTAILLRLGRHRTIEANSDLPRQYASISVCIRHCYIIIFKL